jgi:hypothetical protein
MSKTGVLKSPMEILGVDLRCFVDSDGCFYNERMARFAGERFSLEPSKNENYYDYFCVNEKESFHARREWIKVVANLKVDDKVWVWFGGDRRWGPRHFSHFEGDTMCVFSGGGTSFTAYGETHKCDNWTPFEEGVDPNER